MISATPIGRNGLQSEPAAVDRASLLNSRQMANFVSDGFLRFDGIQDIFLLRPTSFRGLRLI